MKKTALIVPILSTIAFAGAAQAANSQATMKIQGTIVPATCNIDINGSTTSTLQLGKINAAITANNAIATLPSQVATLNISCPSATMVGFAVADIAEKAGQVELNGLASPGLFSLGATPSGAIVGGYTVQMLNGIVDQKSITGFLASDNAETWRTLVSNQIDAKTHTLYSWSSNKGINTPSAGLKHQIRMGISPFINPLSAKDAADKIELRGEATYDLIYL